MTTRISAIAALCLAAASLASPAHGQGSSSPPARTQGQQGAQLEPGANSFTEEQARSRIEQAGYQNVTELRKDDQGIWRARAMRNGQQVTVGLDYRGNIAAQ